jgi:DHA2 family multidrug resistance protein
MVLDLGERRDWFESRFIVTLSIIMAVSLVAAVIREIRHKDPVLDVRLLRERNLGFCTLSMLVFGATLYGSTVMLTLFMQTLLGYTALLSGLAISPGAVLTLFMLPFIGFMVSRVDVRILVGFGILSLTAALYVMTHFSLSIDFWSLVAARAMQGFAMAFIFVPLNTSAYSFIPKEARNAASTLINVARNIGGSVGIAFCTSMAVRWAQVHQTHLVGHMTPYDGDYVNAVRSATNLFLGVTGDPVGASLQAQASLYGIMRQQAAALAYIDVFWVMAIAAIVIFPMVLLMKRPPEHPTELAPH